jgi:hypothetical protein
MYNLRKFFIIFFIEKWQSYLNFAIENSYQIVYAQDLIVYVASNVTLQTTDKEFIDVSKKFLEFTKIMLGPLMWNFYVYLYGKEGLRDYLIMTFIIKAHNDVLKTIVENTKETIENEQ